MTRLDGGFADVLLVAELGAVDGGSSSLRSVIERAATAGWNLVVVNVCLDLHGQDGAGWSRAAATAAGWERRMRSESLRDAVAVQRTLVATLTFLGDRLAPT